MARGSLLLSPDIFTWVTLHFGSSRRAQILSQLGEKGFLRHESHHLAGLQGHNDLWRRDAMLGTHGREGGDPGCWQGVESRMQRAQGKVRRMKDVGVQ